MLGFTKFKINRLVNRRELYSNFSYNKWNQLDTGSKWKCLQQLENHFAAEQGRPAVKVLPISSKEVRGDYGGYDPDKNVIYINRDLVEYGTLVGPVDINHPTQLDANMQLFDTIAHEGYHAYQGYAIKHPGFHKDMKQVKEWAINDRNVKYFRRGDEYLVQPRERDAWKYGSEKTREAFDEIEKYYGTEPGRAMYEKSVEDNSYENALERLWNNNPDALNQMYKEMMDAYEERYWENNSTVNLDPITVDEYDAISREAVNRYYEHLKNNPSLSNEDVMRMTGDMSEKYFSAVEEYKNAVQQKEKSEDRGEKENRTEKYEAQNPENRSIFNPDRVSVEEYDKTLRDQVNKYYEHLKNDPSLSNEDVMRMTEEMSEKYLTAVEEYRNAQKQEDEGFQEKSGDKESTEKRYKKEEIEKENPEHKRDVENQRKEEVEEENKSEKKDKLENREDEKDYEEEGAENKDKTETLSEDELEEERWNESESEDEAELLSDKAEAGEEQNAEDKAVTETESELQDNAADLSSEESSGETEDKVSYAGDYLQVAKDSDDYTKNYYGVIYQINAHIQPDGGQRKDVVSYYSMKFENVIVGGDGKCEIDLDEYDVPYDDFSVEVTSGDLSSGSYSFDGYQTLEELKKNYVDEVADEFDCEWDVSGKLEAVDLGVTSDYLCSYSSDRLLTDSDVEGYLNANYSEYNFPEGINIIQMIINEIYAKHGYEFTDSKLSAYFSNKTWYKSNTNKVNDMNAVSDSMSEIEKKNVDFLNSYR